MKNFEFKISLLELVGKMYTGVGLIMIVKSNVTNNTYESLLWLSPDLENIKDRFIFPNDFLEKERIEEKDFTYIEEFIKRSLSILPYRKEIFKEADK